MLCCCICVSTICAIKEIVNITYVIHNIQNLLSVTLKLTLFGVANQHSLLYSPPYTMLYYISVLPIISSR